MENCVERAMQAVDFIDYMNWKNKKKIGSDNENLQRKIKHQPQYLV